MGKATAKTASKAGPKAKVISVARNAPKPVRTSAKGAAAANGHTRASGPAKANGVAPRPEAGAAGGKYSPYQRLLLAKRLELAGALEESKFDTLARLGRVAEEDQAQISHEEFISLQRNSMDYQALRLVDGALDRIHSGDYGVCEECEEEISEKRLAAIPWAKYCVHCQERIQQAERPGDHAAAEVW